MRFVILTQYYPPEIGAPQVRLASFAKELQRQGHEPIVLTGMPNYPSGVVHERYRGHLLMHEELDGIPVIRTWLFATNSVRFLPRLSSYVSFCLSALLSLRWIRRADFVFVESPPLFLAATAHLIARFVDARWIMNVSDLWPDTVLEMGMVKPGLFLRAAEALERWSYRRASFVVAVTKGIQSRLVDRKSVPKNKVLFLPNGVDTTLFQPSSPKEDLRSTLGLDGRKVFLFAGLHGHAQDLGTIISAAELLRERDDIRIGFIGDGPVKPWAMREVSRRSLLNVFFQPPQRLSDMPDFWSIATAALVTLHDLPVFNGARPSKSFPPMASGVPVIFAGRGEMHDLLKAHGAGLTVAPENPDALAQAIRELADDSALARALGSNARKLVLEQFSWSSLVAQWLNDLHNRSDANAGWRKLPGVPQLNQTVAETNGAQ
jgi:putative colanic acid biosynthesis glycosyltransferase WcaI